MNGNINLSTMETPDGFTKVTDGIYSKGGYTYTINANDGTVTVSKSGEDIQTTPSELSDVEKYILGENGTGRRASEILDNDFQFLDDVTLTPEIDESTAAVSLGGCQGDNISTLYMYMRYNNDGNLYRFKMIGDISDMTSFVTEPISASERIKTISSTDTNIGRTATIDGEKYIVLYGAGEQGENVQLISSNTFEINSVYLGILDGQIDWTDNTVITEANIFNDTEQGGSVLSDVEKTIYSYNNAITTLNSKCAEVVGNSNSDILDVRCVGSNPRNKNSENSTLYTLTFLENNPINSEKYSAGDFNGIIKWIDFSFIDDYDRLMLIGATQSENNAAYWLASRTGMDVNNNITFCMSDVSDAGNYGNYFIISVSADNVFSSSGHRGVRPVISMNYSVLANYLD